MPGLEGSEPRTDLTLVYYGPSGAGKTASLRYLAACSRTPLFELDPDGGRTVYFDALRLELELPGGVLGLRLVSVPGDLMHRLSRRLLLRGADGIILMLDGRRSAALQMPWLAEVRSHLREAGRDLEDIPLVVQVGHADASAWTDEDIAELFADSPPLPLVRACPLSGEGVVEALGLVCSRLIHGGRVQAPATAMCSLLEAALRKLPRRGETRP